MELQSLKRINSFSAKDDRQNIEFVLVAVETDFIHKGKCGIACNGPGEAARGTRTATD
jgi:hypothetical protein